MPYSYPYLYPYASCLPLTLSPIPQPYAYPISPIHTPTPTPTPCPYHLLLSPTPPAIPSPSSSLAVPTQLHHAANLDSPPAFIEVKLLRHAAHWQHQMRPYRAQVLRPGEGQSAPSAHRVPEGFPG